MTRRRILYKTFMLVLIAAAVCGMSVGIGGAAITTEYNGDNATITGVQFNSIIWNASNFDGFNYGFNSQSAETIAIAPFTLHGPNTDRTIDADNLIYTTTTRIKQFEWNQFGNYLVMGFMAEPYFVGYINENGTNLDGNTWFSSDNLGAINLLSGGNMSKVLIDSDDKITISTGDGLELKEGYVLNIQQISLDGNKALLELTKNGRVVDTEVVYPSFTDTGDDIYIYELDIGNEGNVPIIAAHVDDVFRGTDTKVVTIEGIFQISDNITPIGISDVYGAMEVTSIDSTSIRMKNYNDIILERNSIQPIVGNITLKVADSDTISFYPSVEITTDIVDNNPIYTDNCCVWNLSEGYAFALSQVDLEGRKVLLSLIKDGAIVDQEILTEEFRTNVYSDSHYSFIKNDVEIINATLKMAFRGINSNGIELTDINQRSEVGGNILLANVNHIFNQELSDSIVRDELQDGYTLAIADISLAGDEVLFELSKNGIIVKYDLLNVDFSNTSSYTFGMGSIGYSLDRVLRGVHENVVIINNLHQYSDTSGNLLMSNDTNFYKTGDPTGISWALPNGYALTMKDVDIEDDEVWFELSKNGIKLTEYVIRSSDEFTYVNGLESFECTVTGVMHGTLADVVTIDNVNLYSNIGVQLIQNSSNIYATGDPSGDIWELFEGYSLNPKDVDLNGDNVWLSLVKDGNVVKDEIINNPGWFRYYNSAGALIFSTYIDTVFRGTDTNVVTLENTAQYSEISGTLLFQDLNLTTIATGITSNDGTSPTLSIFSPSSGTTISTSTTTISGTASDESGIASIMVNDILATGTTNWSKGITLTEGANTITAVATDTSGNTATDTITITYTPAADTLTGDINGDGILSSVDALMALQMSAGNIAQDPAADVSGDGSVTSLDALMILQASVGAIVL